MEFYGAHIVISKSLHCNSTLVAQDVASGEDAASKQTTGKKSCHLASHCSTETTPKLDTRNRS